MARVTLIGFCDGLGIKQDFWALSQFGINQQRLAWIMILLILATRGHASVVLSPDRTVELTKKRQLLRAKLLKIALGKCVLFKNQHLLIQWWPAVNHSQSDIGPYGIHSFIQVTAIHENRFRLRVTVTGRFWSLGPLLLTWVNFNLCMDKSLHTR